MTNTTTPTPNQGGDTLTGFLRDAKGSPLVTILLVLTLGSQGADYVLRNGNSTTLTELSYRVEQALTEITDNSERIARLENKLDVTFDERLDRIEAELRELGFRIEYGEGEARPPRRSLEE